uniref:Uncharacterized protein n=1 Tax=Plectus sambesii TaxID=2011161 RepID=A0A914XHX6_9BILA
MLPAAALLLIVLSVVQPMPFESTSEEQFAVDDVEDGEEVNEFESDALSQPLRNNTRIVQGDIVEDIHEEGVLNQGIARNFAWPNGVVPYVLDSSIISLASSK